MRAAMASDLLVQLEECLCVLDRLGWSLTGARLSDIVETVRGELAAPSDQPGSGPALRKQGLVSAGTGQNR